MGLWKRLNQWFKTPIMLVSETKKGGFCYMYAVIETGGKQYKVTEGELIQVEKLELEAGQVVEFPALLVVDGEKVVAGNPTVNGVVVKAEVVEHGKSKKLVVFKYKAKKHVRRKQGHRQPFTTLKIVSVK